MNSATLVRGTAAAALAFAMPAIACAAATIDLRVDAPSLDQWSYPFSFAPGASPHASIFAAWIDDGFAPQWDNRDGQMVLGFDTNGAVPTGLAAEAYVVESMSVTVTIGLDGAFEYDPTTDPLSSWLPDREGAPGVDPDPGRPVELFATAFRNGFTAETFVESTPYGPSTFGKGIRNAYPVMFVDGAAVDVSNNVDGRFEATPGAVGVVDGLEPGDSVPLHSAMRFDLDLGQPGLVGHVVAGLQAGRIHLSIASLFLTEVSGSTGFPRLLAKEHPDVIAGIAAAPRIAATITLRPVPDLDGDGDVDGADLGALLAAWGDGGGPADLNFDGVVDGADLGILLGAW